MQSNLSLKVEDCPQPVREAATCGGCGRRYDKPILAKVSTPGSVQTYGACPHCMTKVYDINTPTNKIEGKTGMSEAKSSTTVSTNDVKCDHFFGFLNKRTKGTPVPERCMTCERMVECLYG